MLRLAGELPIVRVLNDFQLLSILRIFCMRGFLPPPADPPWLYACVSGLLCANCRRCCTAKISCPDQGIATTC
ncbi:hypothetical protein CCE08_23640 [Escherichia coli]|nr:hypothetical protein CCE08_23640 [Escherichia coli]